jgi:aminoglycoside phosphotransferase (APT) family kinase protein
MHPDELDIDSSLVGRLLAAQFPDWAGLPVEPVFPRGTDNRLFRLGDDLVVRLPCRETTVKTLEKEREWLPRLAPHLPLEVPVPIADGAPGEGYPRTWSVYRWLEGESAITAPIEDTAQAVTDLAGFIGALQRIDPSRGPRPGESNSLRGAPLQALDAELRAWLDLARDGVDAKTVTAEWEAALQAPAWDRAPVWVHGDLDVRNLLVRDGRLSGVVDFGCLGVGDPACDLAAAWKVLPPQARDQFRSALSVDDATWTRARGWVLHQAVGALSYYTPETNPELFSEAQRWYADALADERTS